MSACWPCAHSAPCHVQPLCNRESTSALSRARTTASPSFRSAPRPASVRRIALCPLRAAHITGVNPICAAASVIAHPAACTRTVVPPARTESLQFKLASGRSNSLFRRPACPNSAASSISESVGAIFCTIPGGTSGRATRATPGRDARPPAPSREPADCTPAPSLELCADEAPPDERADDDPDRGIPNADAVRRAAAAAITAAKKYMCLQQEKSEHNTRTYIHTHLQVLSDHIALRYPVLFDRRCSLPQDPIKQ